MTQGKVFSQELEGALYFFFLYRRLLLPPYLPALPHFFEFKLLWDIQICGFWLRQKGPCFNKSNLGWPVALATHWCGKCLLNWIFSGSFSFLHSLFPSYFLRLSITSFAIALFRVLLAVLFFCFGKWLPSFIFWQERFQEVFLAWQNFPALKTQKM